MIRKFSKNSIKHIQENLGELLEFAHYERKVDYQRIFFDILAKGYDEDFETNRCYYSGIELAYAMTRDVSPLPYEAAGQIVKSTSKSHHGEIYWAGWSLAYFQWDSAIPYKEINKYVSIEEIVGMYTEYHKQDLKAFCKRMISLIKERRNETKFKQRVDVCKFTLEKIAFDTSIDINLLQGFYDGSKSINKLPAKKLAILIKYFGTQFDHLYEYIDDYEI